jgi:hypothetical protein
MSSNDPLILATTALRETPIPDGPDAEMILRAERIAAVRRMNYKQLIAACVAFLCAGTIVFFLMRSSGNIAFADVAKNISETRTFTATLQILPQDIYIYVKTPRIRVVSNDSIFLSDSSNGQTVDLYPASHVAVKSLMSQQKHKYFGDLYDIARSYQNGSDKVAGEKLIGGKKTQGFQLTRPSPIPDQGEETWTLWVDPQTKLPVEVDVTRGGVAEPVMANLKFDVPLEDSLFDMNIPADYQWKDYTTDNSKFFYAGQIVDERGNGIGGVEVTATYQLAPPEDSGLGYIDVVKSDANGRFKIDRKTAMSGAAAANIAGRRVRLDFVHADFLYTRLEDASALSPAIQSDLHVMLRDGKRFSGSVVDAAGKPVAGALVQVMFDRKHADYRKTAITDAQGKFELHGLPQAEGDVQARKTDSPDILVGSVHVNLYQDAKPETVALHPLILSDKTVVHELFGMKLVDVDEKLQSQLDLYDSSGVLILDPGANFKRLDIGTIQAGDYFWMVGNDRVKNFDEFAKHLLDSCREQQKRGRSNFLERVVYGLTRDDFEGTNTEQIRLDENDLAELEKVVKRP